MPRLQRARRAAPLASAALLAATASCSPGGSGARLHFTEVARESGLVMTPTCGLDPPSTLLEMKGGGLALVDFDDDGDPDVFVPNGATLGSPGKGPGCRLFENLGGLRFRDVTADAGLTFDRWGFGTAVGDYDNDGHDDIYVTCYGPNALLRNTGSGGFEEVTTAAGVGGDVWSSASTFADLDLDGDLDLYVVDYVDFDAAAPPPPAMFMGVKVFAGPIGLGAVADVLYENLGDGTFRDVSEPSGVRAVEAGWGLGVVALDFDEDGLPDIFVGNDSEANFLFKNEGGLRFTELGVRSGAAFDSDGAGQATMGIAVADVDGDGAPDLYSSNFMYDGNTLHQNLGGLAFADRTVLYGLMGDSRPFLGWATGFFDFDNDADEDLVVFNGHIYPEETCDANNWDYRQQALLYRRDGPRFVRVPPDGRAGAWSTERHCDRSATFGDLDGDGDVDIVVGERNGPLRLLRNDRDGGNWLSVALDDPRPGHQHRGLGSRIELRAGTTRQVRWLVGGVGFLSASEPVAHFGLPADARAVELSVRWSDGHEQLVRDVRTRERVTVRRE